MALGDERLGTLDESGRRMFIHPAEVWGYFRTRRNVIYTILLIIFLVTPWIKINGQQLILLDISNRTFIFFGFLFKSHDAPLIFLLLAAGTIGLAVFTAVFGRAWCGWACPQTVFIDVVYRRIEILIQGQYFKRRKLQTKSWDVEKIWKLTATWVAFFIVSSIIAHSFVAYFVGSDRLLEMMQGSPEENKTAFLIVSAMTALLLFDFGWFREQFCIIACPYGRIQSVLMDAKSMAVMYDEKRGEPRKGLAPMGERGDCVNCRRCVEVCPTGIDIRRGIQMECIGCTACMDACDDIMTKVKKPTGLIRYSSEFEMQSRKIISLKERILKPRVLLYAILILLIISAFFILVTIRKEASLTLLRKTGAPYNELLLPDGSKQILNHIKIHLHNQSMSQLTFTLRNQNNDSTVEVIAPIPVKILKANSSEDFVMVIKSSEAWFKDQLGKSKIKIVFDVSGGAKPIELTQEVELVGPK